MKQAQTHGSIVSQCPQQRFGFTQGVFDPAPSRHGVLEIKNLLPQTRNLMNEFLLRAVFVSHGKMYDGGCRSSCT
jgi:hypothetical protein